MLPGKTLEELATELSRQNKVKRDYQLDTRNLIMDADENGAVLSMVNDATHETTLLGINDVCHDQISGKLGIPKAYYQKMLERNPALLAENVNAWFNNEPNEYMIRTLDGTARAFLGKRYRRIDNYDIAQSVLPILAELGLTAKNFPSTEVTDTRMYIKVVNDRIQGEVKPGDYVQSGVIITNSEVGMGTVTVRPLLYRLVCTNGMVVNDIKSKVSRRHVGRINQADDSYVLYANDTLLADDQALLLKIRDTIKAALDEVHFTNLLEQMKTAAEVKIETRHIPEMVQLAAPTFGFTLKESEGILDHLIRGGDLTMYGLSNAVTRYAQDVHSYDRSTELESIGYDILTMTPRQWKTLNDVEAKVA